VTPPRAGRSSARAGAGATGPHPAPVPVSAQLFAPTPTAMAVATAATVAPARATLSPEGTHLRPDVITLPGGVVAECTGTVTASEGPVLAESSAPPTPSSGSENSARGSATPVRATTATKRHGGDTAGAKAAEPCKNCGGDAQLYCMACAAALCAACSAGLHRNAAVARIMSGHKPRPREEAAFDMLVARLGGDLPCVSEALQAMMPVGGLAAAAEGVVYSALVGAASITLACDKGICTSVLPECVGAESHANDLAEVLLRMGDRGVSAAYAALAMGRRLASHVAVVTGPFPVVITTNWDELLEAGFRLLRYCEGQITCPGRTVEYIHGRQVETLPVRDRKDVAQLYVEIKAGLQPSRCVRSECEWVIRKGLGRAPYSWSA
jgi:hypothetical protein